MPSVVTSGTRSGASVTKQAWRSQQKTEKGDSPSPISSLCRYRAHKPSPFTELELSVLHAGGGMVPSVVTSGTRSGASVFSGSALRVPEAKRGRVPCDGAEEIYGAPPPEQTQVS